MNGVRTHNVSADTQVVVNSTTIRSRPRRPHIVYQYFIKWLLIKVIYKEMLQPISFRKRVTSVSSKIWISIVQNVKSIKLKIWTHFHFYKQLKMVGCFCPVINSMHWHDA